MRQELLDIIHCPECSGHQFALRADQQDSTEIREGEIICQQCRRAYVISGGILNLLINPTTEIINEERGWTELEKAVVNTDELMLALPDAIGEHKPAWQGQAVNFHYVYSQLRLAGNERVLDLGSGRCWSTRFFARQGCYCIGIDILQTKYVGLRTADVFIKHDNIYFERVCGDMNRLPFRDGMFDIVFVAATMHHTSNLASAMNQISRVLKPGGRVIMTNEPVVGLFRNRRLTCPEVQHGINEHVYGLWEYLGELYRSGFSFQLYPYVGSYGRMVTKINQRLVECFPQQLLSRRMWPPLLYFQLLSVGGVLNLVACKRH